MEIMALCLQLDSLILTSTHSVRHTLPGPCIDTSTTVHDGGFVSFRQVALYPSCRQMEYQLGAKLYLDLLQTVVARIAISSLRLLI